MINENRFQIHRRSSSSKMMWTTPVLEVLDISHAKGANAGPHCDKHGSLSASNGNDSCAPSSK